MLEYVISTYDNFIGKIDYDKMPERESKEYRKLMLKIANEKIFYDGRYSLATECMLEIFDNKDLKRELADQQRLNHLSPLQQQKLHFILDLKEMCYPLFMGQKVDWTAWPWNMKNGEPSMHNKEFYNFVDDLDSNIKAAIIYDITQQIWTNDTTYTSVMRHEISRKFYFEIRPKWRKDYIDEMTDDEKSLGEQLYFFMDICGACRTTCSWARNWASTLWRNPSTTPLTAVSIRHLIMHR